MGTTTSPPQSVRIETPDAVLYGDFAPPAAGAGVVLFAHGSGSSRQSPRNRYVAEVLRDAGFGTLLLDLLTEEEERRDLRTRAWRFDIDLLARRLTHAIDWLASEHGRAARIGLFGASTGAAAALIAAADRPSAVSAVVSRGGRPDLAGTVLDRVGPPTLLVVGGGDPVVIELNRQALALLTKTSAKRLEIVPGASHLFEEPGALEQVARLASAWFATYLRQASV